MDEVHRDALHTVSGVPHEGVAVHRGGAGEQPPTGRWGTSGRCRTGRAPAAKQESPLRQTLEATRARVSASNPPSPTHRHLDPSWPPPSFGTSTPPPRSPGGGPGCGSGSRPRCSARPRPGSCSRPMAEGRQLNASKPRSRLLGCRPWAESPDSFLTPLRTLALWCGIWTSADLRNK